MPQCDFPALGPGAECGRGEPSPGAAVARAHRPAHATRRSASLLCKACVCQVGSRPAWSPGERHAWFDRFDCLQSYSAVLWEEVMCAKVAGGRHEAFPFIDRGAALRAQLAALATVLQCWRPEAALARFASSLACDGRSRCPFSSPGSRSSTRAARSFHHDSPGAHGGP